jgi:hypothetical protein
MSLQRFPSQMADQARFVWSTLGIHCLMQKDWSNCVRLPTIADDDKRYPVGHTSDM